ncbi:hypothetical protein GA0070615_5811 [Micromonospora aurantiaca]|nr:hypothetical protein GA0070615_5811 [Micromonospora aurantiaca]
MKFLLGRRNQIPETSSVIDHRHTVTSTPPARLTKHALIRVLVLRTAELVEAETGEWLSEFRSNIGDLNRRNGWSPATGHPSVGAGQSAGPDGKQADIT